MLKFCFCFAFAKITSLFQIFVNNQYAYYKNFKEFKYFAFVLRKTIISSLSCDNLFLLPKHAYPADEKTLSTVAVEHGIHKIFKEIVFKSLNFKVSVFEKQKFNGSSFKLTLILY